MNKVKIWNIKREKAEDLPDNAAYVGRGSPHGNPFRIGIHGDRDQVCNAFEREVLPKLDVESLRGRDMICYCEPARCHAHSIYKKLYGEDYVPADKNQ